MSKKVLLLTAVSLLLASCSEDSGGTSVVCGNGVVETGEACDDGNTASGDGCSALCDVVEDGYTCAVAGEPCTKKEASDPTDDPKEDPKDPDAAPTCGDGHIDGEEVCDDGNEESGDGCSADCSSFESDFTCSNESGKTVCVKNESSRCGDGRITGDEVCDDGNDESGDGCSADCLSIEENFTCPVEGMDCIPAGCGDGNPDEGEDCDDGTFNIDYAESDGYCSNSCHPAHYCGDGLVDAVDKLNGEECDAGSEDKSAEYMGCSASCKIVNFCGDGKKTHAEQCDDGNLVSGDGCSENCTMEENYICILQDGKSVCSPINCGNGVLDASETCDDGNRVSGDGCSANCQLEKGYALVDDGNGGKVIKLICGDGIIQNVLTGEECGENDNNCEACDDGNLNSNDGCSSVCTIEAGYICPEAGKACVARSCGDGIVAKGEECDDGVDPEKKVPVSGDGCSDRCKVEAGYHCSTPGKPCEKGRCGDGIIDGGETCDEGASTPSGGCVQCQIQKNWKCETPGTPCVATTCGDGVVDGIEECDEQSEGCVECRIVTGYHCDSNGKNCTKGRCGDHIVDAGEQCDDGNQKAGDGCSPLCTIEEMFECIDDHCRPICGDGLTMWEYGEECDDGNLISGDGCSSQCKIENGFVCTDFKQSTPATINIPITYHDFRGWDERGTGDGYATQAVADLNTKCFSVGRGHPDFENVNSSTSGLVNNTLDANGKPVWTGKNGGGITCQESFAMWYRDTPGMNKTFNEHLTLTQVATGQNKYQYYSGSFFPLTDKGYGNSHNGKNFGFTSELSTYFKFNGGETLDFSGDDDVWVFINGVLAVDIGGVHGETKGSVTLNTTQHSGGDQWSEKYGIFAGGIYNIKLFQAERHTSASNYKLTLSGFVNMGASACASVCGDGIIAGNEECDYKTDNLDDVEQQKANGCKYCKLAPSCGNGKVESGEGCDYQVGVNDDWCSPTCQIMTCGDNKLDPHEQCDGDKGISAGQVCLPTCRISGCGDGYVDVSIGEECDDGNQSNDDACTTACKAPFCGDNIVSPSLGEVCDDGVNDGSYNGCGIGCTYVPPRCGDGVVDSMEGEECDDGENGNVGGYGRCKKDCKLDIRCGDGVLQEEFEQCDPKLDVNCTESCQFPIN